MSLIIRRVETSSDLDKFVTYPFDLYKESPCWVPPLIAEEKKLLTPGKHPFHNHAKVALFLAQNNGRIVGRISAHINHNHNEYHNDRTGFFGFFECCKDQEIAAALFQAAEDFVRKQGMNRLRGPMNFTTNETCGLLINYFDEMPYIMMPYNFPYYVDLMEANGFEKSMDLFCYHLDEEIFKFDRLGSLVKRIQKRSDVNIRPIRKDRFEDEVRIIQKVYNTAWKDNWGFVPMNEEEFQHMVKELKPIYDPRLLYIGEFEGKPVGFVLCLPDYNQVLSKMNGRILPFGWLKALLNKGKINRIRIITLGVMEEHRRSGLDVLFYSKIANVSPAIGKPSGEMGWILEKNVQMNRVAKSMGGRQTKIYRIYDKNISGGSGL